MTRTFHVTALWDYEAGVWSVVDTDVAGLATESATWDGLIANIRDLAPMLLRENGQVAASEWGDIPIEVTARQVEHLHLDG